MGVRRGPLRTAAQHAAPALHSCAVRVIFLDIDGVLNSERWFQRGEADRLGPDFDPELDAAWIAMLDPDAVARLDRLVTASGAKVVVSSSWRMMVSLPDLASFLAMRGFTGEIIDATTTSQGLAPDGVTERGHQIAHWLAANRVTSFVILDDQTDMAHLGDRHVLTTWERGLTEGDVERALALLAKDV